MPNEDLSTTIRKLATTLDLQLNQGDITDIYRTKRGSKQQAIIMKTANTEIRNIWINKHKQKKTTTATQLYPSLPNDKVYINEALIPAKRKLLYETKQHAKENNIKFVWIKEGQIYTREKEGAKARRINDIKELSETNEK